MEKLKDTFENLTFEWDPKIFVQQYYNEGMNVNIHVNPYTPKTIAWYNWNTGRANLAPALL